MSRDKERERERKIPQIAHRSGEEERDSRNLVDAIGGRKKKEGKKEISRIGIPEKEYSSVYNVGNIGEHRERESRRETKGIRLSWWCLAENDVPGPPGSRKLILLLSRRRLPFSLFFACYLVPSICSVSRSTGFPPRWKGTLKSEPETTFILRILLPSFPLPFLFLSLHLTFARHHTLLSFFFLTFLPSFLPSTCEESNNSFRIFSLPFEQDLRKFFYSSFPFSVFSSANINIIN